MSKIDCINLKTTRVIDNCKNLSLFTFNPLTGNGELYRHEKFDLFMDQDAYLYNTQSSMSKDSENPGT